MFKILGLFFQKIINIVSAALGALVGLLPNSPFTFVANSQFADLVAKINFFIPIYEFMAILQAWLVAVGVYYLYSIFARWVKAIQ